MEAFSDRLYQAVRDRHTPVMVGLDPRYDLLPTSLRPDGSHAGLAARAAACAEFCRGVIDVVAPLVPVVARGTYNMLHITSSGDLEQALPNWEITQVHSCQLCQQLSGNQIHVPPPLSLKHASMRVG